MNTVDLLCLVFMALLYSYKSVFGLLPSFVWHDVKCFAEVLN